MGTITMKQFQEFAQQRIREGIVNPLLFSAKLKEIFDYAVANEAAMDAEANAYFDRIMNSFAEITAEAVSRLPDSSDKRKMLRAAAFVQRKHHAAKGFLNGLGRPLVGQFPIVEAARPVFLTVVQSILDVLFDATRESQHGPAQFATITMLYWAVDELTVAFYLAQQKYATQSYAHVRTVSDLLDKVELFLRQPDWAEVWGSNDKKKILTELSPSAVRRKLGKAKFNAIYSFLSEVGVHGTFEAVRRRVVRKGERESRTQVAIWVGGVPWDSEVVASVSCCIFAAMSTLIEAVSAFKSRLHDGETLEMLRARSNETVGFLRQHFVPWAEKEGLDTSELLVTLSNPPVL